MTACEALPFPKAHDEGEHVDLAVRRRWSAGCCGTLEGCQNLLYYYCNADDGPSEVAADPVATLTVCLEVEEGYGPPENDIQSVENCICLVASPSLKLLDVFGTHFICDEDERFSTLFRAY